MKFLTNILYLSGALIKKSPFIFNTMLKIKPSSLRIIYYHVVSDQQYPYYFDDKSISSEEFEHQIRQFQRHYDIISMNEALSLASAGQSLKGKLVITFDDGFIDNYTIAAPILTKLNCTATFYLIGSCIDNKHLMWRNKLVVMNRSVAAHMLAAGIEKVSETYHLENKGASDLMRWSFSEIPMDKKDEIVSALWDECMDVTVEAYLNKFTPYMTSTQIKTLSEEGFEMGCHSMTHPVFSRLSYADFKSEIVEATRKIEEITNVKVTSFSYPFGQRASKKFEDQLLSETSLTITTFLGTRNRLNNTAQNKQQWERDNLEFKTELALSRFFLVSAMRSLRK